MLWIKNKTILNTTQWYAGAGEPNVDYVDYVVYEPSIMFDWILERRRNTDSVYQPLNDGDVPGLIVDVSKIFPDTTKPIFRERLTPNIFVEKYLEKISAAE